MMPYSPAARGNMASSSAYVSAPASDSKPATSHTVKALPGVPTLHVITRAFRNTPVPMTFATLTEIAATSPRPRMSSVWFEVSGFKFVPLEADNAYGVSTGSGSDRVVVTAIRSFLRSIDPVATASGTDLTFLCNLCNLRINVLPNVIHQQILIT